MTVLHISLYTFLALVERIVRVFIVSKKNLQADLQPSVKPKLFFSLKALFNLKGLQKEEGIVSKMGLDQKKEGIFHKVNT